MTNSTTFINRQTPITADWLNDVNSAVFGSSNIKQFPYNAKVDGTTDDSAAIVSMMASMGFATLPSGNTRISTNIALTGMFVFNPGAYITIDSGITVTIDGVVSSPNQYIFQGTGTVSFGGDPATNTYSAARVAQAEWFGVQAGSNADQIPALQLAVNAMGSTREGIIYLPMGTITAKTTLTLNRGVKLIGKGSRRTVFSMAPDGVTGIVSGGVAGWIEGIQFDIAFGSYKNGGYCIDIQHQDWTVLDVSMAACTQGIRLAGSNCKAKGIINVSQPSVLVAGSCLVDLQASDCLVDDVNIRGSVNQYLESVVRVEFNSGAGYSRATIQNVDSTVTSSTAVNIIGGSQGVANITVRGVQQNGTGGTGVGITHAGTSSIHEIILSSIQVGALASIAVSASNSGAGSIQRLLIDDLNCGSGLATGISLSQSSGLLQLVKIGFCDLSGCTTPITISGTITDLRIDPTSQNIPRKAAQTFSQTIANNAVFSLATGTSIFGSQVLVSVSNVEYGIFLMRAAATPAVVAVTTVSTNMASTTGVLTGTTGTVGKFTVSTDASGNFYFENRLGSSALAQITFMTGIQTIVL